jgi:hypothetical protein
VKGATAEAAPETVPETREGEGARTSTAAGAAPALRSLTCSMLTLCQQAPTLLAHAFPGSNRGSGPNIQDPGSTSRLNIPAPNSGFCLFGPSPHAAGAPGRATKGTSTSRGEQPTTCGHPQLPHPHQRRTRYCRTRTRNCRTRSCRTRTNGAPTTAAPAPATAAPAPTAHPQLPHPQLPHPQLPHPQLPHPQLPHPHPHQRRTRNCRTRTRSNGAPAPGARRDQAPGVHQSGASVGAS